MLLIIVQTQISVQGGNFNYLQCSLKVKGTPIVVKNTEKSLKIETLPKNVGKLDFYNDFYKFLVYLSAEKS